MRLVLFDLVVVVPLATSLAQPATHFAPALLLPASQPEPQDDQQGTSDRGSIARAQLPARRADKRITHACKQLCLVHTRTVWQRVAPVRANLLGEL